MLIQGVLAGKRFWNHEEIFEKDCWLGWFFMNHEGTREKGLWLARYLM